MVHTNYFLKTLFVILSLLYHKTKAPDYSIELFTNEQSDKCIHATGNFFKYLVKGHVTIDTNVRIIGFQKAKINSNKFYYGCIIDISKERKEQSTRSCYCTSTNKTHVYDIVWNTTLREGESQGKIRAVLLIYNKDKFFSNEHNLPTLYNPGKENIKFELLINDQTINTSKCMQTITNDTITIQYNPTSNKTIPIIISISDGDTVTRLRENTVETYLLKTFHESTKTHLSFEVDVCSKVVNKFHCTFNKALHINNIVDNTNLEDFIAIGIGTSILLPIILLICLRVCEVKQEDK